MLDSVMAVVALAALALLALGVINPVIGLIVLALAVLPLGVMLAARLFRHTSSTVSTGGPAVPSTAEASYDAVPDPANRG